VPQATEVSSLSALPGSALGAVAQPEADHVSTSVSCREGPALYHPTATQEVVLEHHTPLSSPALPSAGTGLSDQLEPTSTSAKGCGPRLPGAFVYPTAMQCPWPAQDTEVSPAAAPGTAADVACCHDPATSSSTSGAWPAGRAA
jgi:hypothetical protein